MSREGEFLARAIAWIEVAHDDAPPDRVVFVQAS